MGFGLLFIGYATLLMFRSIPIELIGFFLVYMAIEKLQKVSPTFKYVKYVSVYMFFESALYSAMWFCKFTRTSINVFENPVFIMTENILYHAGLLLFNILLCKSIIDISKNVGYNKGVSRAKFSIATTIIFYLSEVFVGVLPRLAKYMSIPLAVFQIFSIFLILFTIFGCYMMIVNDELLEKEEQKYISFVQSHGGKKNETKTIKNNMKGTTKRYKAQRK